MQPLISVIIPAYNYARFLPEAVTSILDQNQDGFTVEIIVVDDGSTDDTAEVARRLGADIRYIHQENQGLSAARNTGIQAARGDYLTFLDADDLHTRDTLASQLANFTAHPDLDISICLCLQTHENGDEPYLWPLLRGYLDVHFCNANIAPVHSFMIRAAAVRQTGFFDISLKACEDQDYWLRCVAGGLHFGCNADGLVIYRKHSASMTSQTVNQLVHDAAMHKKVSHFLTEKEHFPATGKFSGWLAHASGCLDNAFLLQKFNPMLAATMREHFAHATRQTALSRRAAESRGFDTDLSLIHEYYACRTLRIAMRIETLSSTENRALSMLRHMFPYLARMELQELDKCGPILWAQLHLPQENMIPTLKKYRP